MSQQVAYARSPLSLVFLLHIALEVPIAVQGIWAPQNLPFMELNNTTLVFLKLYSALLLGTCVASLLCFSLPEYLPGKRAFVISLCIYHSICSTILFQAPRFIPASLGVLAESYKVIPETVWGTLHGILGLVFMAWWQVTVPAVTASRMMAQ